MTTVDYIHVPESNEIIINWFLKAKKNIEFPLDSFIEMWISFNCFYTSRFYCKTLSDLGNANDFNIVKTFCSEPKYRTMYLNLLVTSESFQDILRSFLEILKNTKFPGKIRNLRPDMRENENEAKPFSSIGNFEEFIWITYQIRNNLFHGNKSTQNDADLIIVQTISNAFMEYLGEIYKEEGLLSDNFH